MTQVNLTGMQFDRLTVTEFAFSKNQQRFWLCRCVCGIVKPVRGKYLTNGNTRSCGCLHTDVRRSIRDDLSGKEFGLLVVLRPTGERSSAGTVYLCRCRCGNEISVSRGAFARQRSCGCTRRKSTPVQLRLKRRVSSSVRCALLRQGANKGRRTILNYLPYTIDALRAHLESLWEPWMSWENSGGAASDPRKTWHIDHIVPHSSFPYTSMDDPLFTECWKLSNLRPLEKIANLRKAAKISLGDVA